jgi:uncharacterized protein YuzE
MKIKYDREKDILLLELSSEPIDFAEESGSLIIHFSKEEKPVVVEILDASEFLSTITKVTMKTKESEMVEAPI